MFAPSIEACQQYQKGLAVHMEGQRFLGGMPFTMDVNADADYGHISAIDAATGEVRWRHRDHEPMGAGVPATRMVGYGGRMPEGDDGIWKVVAFLKASREAC